MSNYPLTVWIAENYNSASGVINIPYGEYANVSNIGVPNNSISSIKVAPFTVVVMWEDFNFGGAVTTIYGPIEIPRMYAWNGGWNDRVSSLKVVRFEPPVADKLKCCQGQSTAYSCGEFQPGSQACNTTYSNYCAADKLGDPMCQLWCRQNTHACDPRAVQYCGANPADPFCSCILSPANVNNVINPKCADKKCINSGYVTTAMQTSNCPSIVNCSVRVNLENSGVTLSENVPIQQNCGVTSQNVPDGATTIPTGSVTSGTTNSVGGTGTQPQGSGTSSISAQLYLVLFFFIIFIAILVRIYVTRSNVAAQ